MKFLQNGFRELLLRLKEVAFLRLEKVGKPARRAETGSERRIGVVRHLDLG